MTLLSGDPPRGRALKILIALMLLLAPFLFPGAKALNTAAKTCVMVLLVASYDVLLGYTAFGASWAAAFGGLAVAFALSLALALAIGLFSLRVQSIFFAIVTLAVAYAFNVLASQLSWLTGGEDGRSFKVPAVLEPGFKWLDHPVFGAPANGELLAYYLVFFVAAAAFLVLLRIVNAPFGRVLQAIRENPFRAGALGYRIVFHRTLATSTAALGATLAGALNALGSLYGAIIGAALFVVAESYMQDLMGTLASLAADARLPVLPALFDPHRWLLWPGLAFVQAVYFAPLGVAGALAPSEPKTKSIDRDRMQPSAGRP
jgi:branched-chain amino acid transport system permease protein